MVVYIIIGGESQCEVFAQVCLVADYLTQKLPNFCYERVDKGFLEWPNWLCKVNINHNWHHVGSPIVWKELLLKGSKAYYIGGASEFFEYIHAYYNFDVFMGPEKYAGLAKNLVQFKRKIKTENLETQGQESFAMSTVEVDTVHKDDFVVCISGAACPLARILTSRLLDMCRRTANLMTISKIFLYDEHCSQEFLESIEHECSYIGTNYPGKVVKYTDKIGKALTIADLLIVLDHEPFDPNKSIGEWLHSNMRLMQNLAHMINVSASRSMYIILANLGPACFNATVLMHSVNVTKRNIIVASSDLGLDLVTSLAESVEVSARKMYCPPVWGFVGINQLVDPHTTVHKYNSFEPYNRYTRIRNSTLTIGSLTPELRTLEYLTYFNEEPIWQKMARRRALMPSDAFPINKMVAILNLIKLWLLNPVASDYIVNLGILCDGSFGLTFDGAFSQPAKLIGREWWPASEFMLPKDKQMKLPYMQCIAEMCMKMGKHDLPPLNPSYPCACKVKYVKKKEVW